MTWVGEPVVDGTGKEPIGNVDGVGRGGIFRPASTTPRNRAYGSPYPIVYGTADVKASCFFLTDQGNKKFRIAGPSAPEEDLHAAEVQYAFAFGPVVSTESLVYEKRLYGAGGIAFQQLSESTGGYLNPPEFFIGNGTATTWSPYTGTIDASYKVAWPMLAYMRCRYFGIPGGKGAVPAIKAVVRGIGATHSNAQRNAMEPVTWTRYDAAPGDVIRDLIENTSYGMGLPAGTVITAIGADGAAASSYDRYCEQNGWWIALAIENGVAVSDIIAQVLTATNSTGYWSGANFKIIPLGDIAVGTYTPVLTALAITNDDFIAAQDQDAIRVSRQAWADTYNVVPVEYSADTALRTAELVTIETMDVANVQSFGIRRSPDTLSLPCIRSAAHAQAISGIMARRSCWHRSRFEFTITARQGAALECGDLVALTHSVMGLSNRLARVDSIEAKPDGTYRVEAREWVTGASVTVVTTPEGPLGFANPVIPDTDTNAAVSEMGSDGRITPSEKKNLWEILKGLHRVYREACSSVGYQWQADGSGSLNVAGNLLWTYLNGLPSAWSINWCNGYNHDGSSSVVSVVDAEIAAWMALTDVVDPATWRAKFRGLMDEVKAYDTNKTTALHAVRDAPSARTLLGPTGTPSSTTFLRGDGSWATPAGGGTVTGVTATAPIVSSGGTAPVISTSLMVPSASGARWSATPQIGADGVMEVGKYIDFHETNAATTDYDARMDSSAGVISVSGGFVAAGNVTAYSDARLKRAILAIPDALTLVGRMRGVTFERIDRPEAGRQIGVVAQEMRELCPEVVAEGKDGMLSVAYGNLVAVLIEAVKELTVKVAALEARL
jgi:hypothetical protein